MTPIKIPNIALDAIGPEMVLTVTAMALLMIEVFADKKGRDHLGYIALGGSMLAGVLAYKLSGVSLTTFGGLYVVDNFSSFFKIIFMISAGLTTLISVKYAQDEGISHGEYYAMILLATVGMCVMASGRDLITIFMGVEVMSISLYVLAGMTRTRDVSNEASLKYFILGAFSSGFLLYGMALVYGATGTTQLQAIGKAAGALTGNPMFVAGAVMMTIGFAFKVAAVPFHMWTPDVYQGSPAPVTAFMSTGPKAAAFAAFLRVFAEGFPAMKQEWWLIIWALAVLTMTMGNVVALVQNDVKRMLAYSSIAHAGYVLVGLAVASPSGSSGAAFYLLVYAFMNIGAFTLLIVAAGKGERLTTYQDFSGMGRRSPLTALALTIMVFSLAGIPPTAGFAGKFYLFMSALEKGFVWLAVIAVINSVVSVFYYLKLVVYMYMREEDGEARPEIAVAAPLAVAAVVAVCAVMWLGIMPAKYIEFAKSAFLTF